VSIWILSVVAALAAPPPAQPLPAEGVAPLHASAPDDDADALPVHVTAPLTRHRPRPSTSNLPVDGAAPLEPEHTGRDAGSQQPEPATPLGEGPPRPVSTPLDRKSTLMTRLDFLVGPVWRLQRVDTMLTTNLEVGQMHGFAGTFHTELIVAIQEDNIVRALDVPIGFGAVARGRLRNKPLYASVGLSAGILVHRAGTDADVFHRVDPDFRLPIRFAWTIAGLGISLAVVQGYSIRRRSYERRGVEVWARHPYRVALLIGLHWDKVFGRTKVRQGAARKGGRQRE
jgi:hypothetical protein